MKGYSETECPNVESFRKRMSQLKTGMQTRQKIETEMKALRATIEQYS